MIIFSISCIIFSPVYGKERLKVTVDGKKAVGKLFAKAKSCTPRLEWSDIRKGDGTFSYDIAIYYALKGEIPGIGENVFYKASHYQNSISVTPPLKPKTKYLWSFRLRHGSRVSEWYIHHPSKSLLGGIVFYENMLFGIKTPRKCR